MKPSKTPFRRSVLRGSRVLKTVIPRPMRRAWQTVVRYPMADRESVRCYHALQDAVPDSGIGSPLSVRLTPLEGEEVRLRPGSSDVQVLWEVFVAGDHLPPDELLGQEARAIVDLGANIGLSMAHMAVLFPDARVVGVEPDPGNAALCRANVQAWGERCSVIEAAVWIADGRISFAQEPGEEWAGHVEPESAGGQEGHFSDVRSACLNTVLREAGLAEGIDYLKMDIEGAERQLLRENVEWAERVSYISVEVHSPYRLEECMWDLRRLGFEPLPAEKRRTTRVLGRRSRLG